MSTTRLVSIVALVITTAASSAVTLATQEAGPLATGTRIRVRLNTTPPTTLVGTVDALRNDTLSLRLEAESRVLPLSSINTLDVSRGRHSNAGKGAVIGGASLGLLGLAAGAACGEGIGCPEGAGQVALVAGVSAAFGAGMGALIGWMGSSERWEAVPLTTVRVAPVSLNGVGITLSLSF